MPELYFPSIVRRLSGKGFTVIGTRDWYGSVHFQTAPKPYFTDGHPDEIDLKEAEAFGREMAENSPKIKAGETQLIPPVPPHALTFQLLVLLDFYQSGHNPHGRITYNKEKCLYPKCHICMDNCLMGYIDLSKNPPVHGSLGNGCDMWMGCTFCELVCPTGAISGPWDEVPKTEDGPTTVTGENPLEMAAEKAIKSGRLRLLVPREKIRFDTPYFKVYSKRPRFKIPKDE